MMALHIACQTHIRPRSKAKPGLTDSNPRQPQAHVRAIQHMFRMISAALREVRLLHAG